MKSTVKSIIILSLGALIYSCSSTNDVAGYFGIQKRKYTKGYSISKNKKISTKSEVFENEISYYSKKSQINVNLIEKSHKTNQVDIASSSQKENTEFKQEVKIQNKKKSKFKKYSSNHSVALNSVNKIENNLKSRIISNKIKTVKSKISKSKASDDDIIIYYLLAFLIPFLAVGLVTDWDVSQVVLNLILTLLCVIPGIIHAFIVVRDNY